MVAAPGGCGTVSGTARYYLRCLEKAQKGEKEPAWVANEDPTTITLAHVMPQTTCAEWGMSAQDVETYSFRLGNLALLQASQNVLAARSTFSEKKRIFAKAPYELTRMIADYDRWTVAEIEDRQRKLAELAPRTWPT